MQRSGAPEIAEVRGNGLRITANENSRQHQTQQCRNFGDGEDVLNNCAGSDAKNIDESQDYDNHDSAEILGVQAYIHVAQNHWPYVNRRHFGDMPDPIVSRDRTPEEAEELAERDTYRRDGSGLNYKEKRPAIEESPERTQSFAQINILSPGAGHHRRQFAIRKRADNGHESGDHPGHNQQPR